ncbi:hypothetical protein [Pelagovum pacificum]|uniref:Uncharacterized protein n=1 Tax=Pelagovum pacificum TaxID=2588711 RepID=A0A5C5GF27_9RHOB|nr:hypothetical protein [Pelagovum pacificum]QQA43502.1 hypothetical protein I8N54_02690 [Pelagovum pacificum]TNY33362.1 hypothetical protein FHY64_08840 [Pelagovum pacificum]
MSQPADSRSEPTIPSVSITFRPVADDFHLQSLNVVDGDARIAVSFNDARPLGTTLKDRAAREVRQFLDRAGEERGMWSFPDERIVLRDLLLAEPRLIVSHRPTLGRVHVLRFNRFYGQVMGLFDASVRIANPLRSQLEDLAFRTVEGAMLPLFNLSEFLETNRLSGEELDRIQVSRMVELLDQLREKIGQLQLHYLILSRTVSKGTPDSASRLSTDLMELIDGEDVLLAENDDTAIPPFLW